MLFSSRLKIIYTPAGIAGAVYVGLFEMGITFVLWLKALKLSRTTAQVSNLIYMSPFVSLVLIHFVVGERILLTTLIGLIFIITGIVIQQYSLPSIKPSHPE
jgi:drug/metabolite transporter (DMT)-like permease